MSIERIYSWYLCTEVQITGRPVAQASSDSQLLVQLAAPWGIGKHKQGRVAR